jgi:hypothetical protein
MGEEGRIENLDKEGYRSMWETLQSPVWDIVRARSLVDHETPYVFLNLLKVD